VTPTQLGVVFLGVIGGYWAVSSLIDRARKRGGSDAAAPAPTPRAAGESAPAPEPASASTAAPATEAPRPARSVWDEFNGGRPGGPGASR
jgi:hypothetical protein